MTLVDLPGIARLPVGDQPPDVEARTMALCRAYISPPSTVILAVTPAHCDLVTSDALRLARDADPAGARTLGVLTKADVMEAGTDVAGLLSGVGGPVPLGRATSPSPTGAPPSKRRPQPAPPPWAPC